VDRERGQATVETVLLVPLLVVLLAAVWAGLTWATWSVDVEDAAAAGARAATVGQPVRPAVLAALPRTLRGAVQVTSSRSAVTVRVHVAVPAAGYLRLQSSAPVVRQ
jgi:Flp pilus assembly protein TadG